MSNDHQMWCPLKGTSHSDAAKRIADTYNLHRLAEGHAAIGRWFACSLSEGRSNHTLYDTKLDAVRGQRHNEQWYTFIKVGPQGMNPCEAEVMLKTARRLYDNGMRMTDPDHRSGGPDAIKRLTTEDQLAMAFKGIAQNLRMPWEAN